MNKYAFFLKTTLLCLASLLLLHRCQPPIPEPAGTVYIRYEAAVTSLNPLMAGAVGYSRYASEQVFQSLGIIDPQSLELKPLLATAVPKARKVNAGPYAGTLAYDFEIHPKAVWDNGSEITANDVLFTYKLIYHPLLPTGIWQGYLEQMKGVEVDPNNPKKFTIYLGEYYILAVEGLCLTPIYPAYHYDPTGALRNVPLSDLVDPEKAKEIAGREAQKTFAATFTDPKFATDPVSISGSGAYTLESLDSDRGLTLARKTAYWGDQAVRDNPLLAAYPEKLVYRVVKSEEATANMLRSGELDIALNLNANTFLELQQDTALRNAYDFKTMWQSTFTRWLFNARNPKLADVQVRQALSQLVDYDYLIQTVSAGLANRTVGPIPPNKPYYAKNVPLYQYEPEKAKTLLTAAGWTDSDQDGVLDKVINGKKTPLELTALYSPGSATTTMVANSIVESAKTAGVKIVLVPAELAKISKDTRSGDFETALLAAGPPPTLFDFYQYYHSASLIPAGDNRSGVVDPELDAVIVQVRGTENEAARNKAYVRAQEIIHELAPEVFLLMPQQRYVVSKRFDYVISSNKPGFYERLFKLR